MWRTLLPRFYLAVACGLLLTLIWAGSSLVQIFGPTGAKVAGFLIFVFVVFAYKFWLYDHKKKNEHHEIEE